MQGLPEAGGRLPQRMPRLFGVAGGVAKVFKGRQQAGQRALFFTREVNKMLTDNERKMIDKLYGRPKREVIEYFLHLCEEEDKRKNRLDGGTSKAAAVHELLLHKYLNRNNGGCQELCKA